MNFVRFSLMALGLSIAFGSCLKKSYDSPPSTAVYDPNLPVQTTLKQISDMGPALSLGHGRILGDTTVYGVIVADDQTGNYYKQIVIEDTSGGGIVVYINNATLYSTYPVGRKIYMNLKGLTLVNYKGLPEIVYSVDTTGTTAPIPFGLIGNYITKANYPNTTVQAHLVSIDEIKSHPNTYINTLVTISGVQFDAASAGTSYALASATSSSTNRVVEKCDHSVTVPVHTSGYCTFQPYITPTGNGTLTGIVSFYNGLQFIIRDTTDAKMTNPRCP